MIMNDLCLDSLDLSFGIILLKILIPIFLAQKSFISLLFTQINRRMEILVHESHDDILNFLRIGVLLLMILQLDTQPGLEPYFDVGDSRGLLVCALNLENVVQRQTKGHSVRVQ